jgi:hypothetical protein
VTGVELFYKVGSVFHSRGRYPLVFRVGVIFPFYKIPDASFIGGESGIDDCFDFIMVGFTFHNFRRGSCVVGAMLQSFFIRGKK